MFSEFLNRALNSLLPAALAIETGLEQTARQTGLTKSDIPTFIGNIIGYALSFVGAIFLILMVYGGFLWMTSRGEMEKANKAKDLITDAGIGLIIIIASYTITHFVIQALINP